jgi:glucose-1-phosphate thymidylyltransferase
MNIKAIILAGGHGTRLSNFTKYTSKQLLPIYDKPMVWYPYQILKLLGFNQIALICKNEFFSDFRTIFKNEIDQYFIQDNPTGLPDAFKIVAEKKWLKPNEGCGLILGDNLFFNYCNIVKSQLEKALQNNNALISGLRVFEPERYGVIHKDSGRIIEKPKEYIGNLAVPGFYYYPNDILEKVKLLQPSKRGETEIAELSNIYIDENRMNIVEVNSPWFDCGTYDSLLQASNYVHSIKKRLPQNEDLNCW